MIVAKVGDVASGTCVCVPVPPGPFPATGVIMNGSPMVTTTGLPIAVSGLSMVMFPCGTSIIVPGTPTLLNAGAPSSKMGDVVTGCGIGTLMGTSTITSL